MKAYAPKERCSAAIEEGFDSDPEPKNSGPGFFVYRAHGDTSRTIGRFFFTPQIEGTPMVNWTADMLERELNASLWDNDFCHLAKFRVREKVKYKIGAIAHDRYRGTDKTPWGGGLAFDQYAYFRNAGLFLQVQIDGITPTNWRQYLDLVEDTPLRAGRLHRIPGTC